MSDSEEGFNFKLTAKNGVVKTSTEQVFKIARADAVVFLKQLNQKSELHDGEKKLKAFLHDALQKPGWKKLIVRKKL